MCRSSKISAFLFITFVFFKPTATFSQNNSDNFYQRIAQCAAGADFQIDADLEGSIETLFSGNATQGEGSIDLKTKWIELFPLEDRLEAAKLYHKCIENSLSSIDNSISEKFEFACRLRKSTSISSMDVNVDVNIDLRSILRSARQQIDFGAKEFYFSKENDVYRKNRNGKYVKTNRANLSVSDIEIEVFQKTSISERAIRLLGYKPIRLNRQLDRQFGLRGTHLDTSLYISKFGTLEVGVLMRGIHSETGQFVVAQASIEVADCELF